MTVNEGVYLVGRTLRSVGLGALRVLCTGPLGWGLTAYGVWDLADYVPGVAGAKAGLSEEFAARRADAYAFRVATFVRRLQHLADLEARVDPRTPRVAVTLLHRDYSIVGLTIGSAEPATTRAYRQLLLQHGTLTVIDNQTFARLKHDQVSAELRGLLARAAMQTGFAWEAAG